MLINLRRTALAAAIALIVVRAEWILGQVVLFATVRPFQWIAALSCLGNALFLVPLPFFLLVLYHASPRLNLSEKLSWLAWSAAATQAVLLALPRTLHWFVELRRNVMNIRMMGRVTVADALWDWFPTTDAHEFLTGSLVVSSEAAFALFLVALARQRQDDTGQPCDEYRGLGEIALVTTIAGALAVLLNLGRIIYVASRYSSWWNDTFDPCVPSTRWQYFWHNAPSILPLLCWALAPLIVYLALRRRPHPAEEPATEPVESGS